MSMLLSPHVTKTGESLPPKVADGLYGEVKVRIDKLLWNAPRHAAPAKAVVRAVWWGGTEHGQIFDVSNSLQKTLSTTVTFPVHTSKPAFAKYVDDMCRNGGGLRITVANGLSGAVVGAASVDISPLIHDKLVQGFHSVWSRGEELGRVKLRISAAVRATARGVKSPPGRGAGHRDPQERPQRGAPGDTSLTPPAEVIEDARSTPPQRVASVDDHPVAYHEHTAPPPPSPPPAAPPRIDSVPRSSTVAPQHRSVSETPSYAPRAASVAPSSAATPDAAPPTLSSVFDKALRMRRDLSQCNSLNTLDAYEASITQAMKPPPAISTIALPPPVYTPFLLGDDYASEDDDDTDVDETYLSGTDGSESSFEGHAMRVLRERVPLTAAEAAPATTTTPASTAAAAAVTAPPSAMVPDDVNDVIVTVYLGDVRLIGGGGGSLSLRWRLLGSRCVGVAPGSKASLPHDGAAVAVDAATNLAAVGEEVPLRLSRRNPGTSHLVVELSVDDARDGSTACLGVLDLPHAAWSVAAAPTALRSARSLTTEAVVDPLTNAPSCIVSYAVTLRHAAVEPAAVQPYPALASTPGQESVSSAARSAPPLDDPQMKIRRVEVVHTYAAANAPQVGGEYDPTLTAYPPPAPTGGAAAPPPRAHPAPPPSRVRVRVVCGEDLPAVHVEGETEGVPPSCAVVLNDTVATRVVRRSHEPRWDEELHVPVDTSGTAPPRLYLKLWHEGQYIAEAQEPIPLQQYRQEARVDLFPPAAAVMNDGLDGPIGHVRILIDAWTRPRAPAPHSERCYGHTTEAPVRGPRTHYDSGLAGSDMDASLGMPALHLQLDSLTSDLQKRLASLDAP